MGLSLLQGKTKSRTYSRCASEGYGLRMGFQNMLYNCQAQSRSSNFAGATLIGAVKAFEHPYLVFFFNPDAIIGNFN